MSGHDIIRDLGRRFLPPLRSAREEIRTAFPEYRVQVWSQTHGQKTESPGHVIGLSCFFPNAPLDQPDEVVLELGFAGVFASAPTVNVDLIWGHPGQIELDLFPGAVALTNEALNCIKAELPRLVEVFRVAVRRGRPDTPRNHANEKIHAGQRVSILSGGCKGMCGVVEVCEEDRQVANVILDQPCEYSTSEEDYDNLEVIEP